MSEELIVTGLTEVEFSEMIENGATKGKCYLCKRSGDDEGVVVDEDGDTFTIKIETRNLSVQVNDEMILHYPLCNECLMLLHSISKMVIQEQLPTYSQALSSDE
jgi:hypothetical protein